LAEPLYYYREDSSSSASKLLRAYTVGRQIIVQDAKNRFSLSDKTFSYLRSILQSFVVKALDYTNGMEFIRSRRLASEMLEADRHRVESEIAAIKDVKLPVR